MSTTDLQSTAQPDAALNTGLIAYFARNPVAANLLMVFLIVGGIISGSQIPIQQLPRLDLRTVTVTVPSPGSSPQEIEADVNRRIEESILGLSGVERVVTTATQGLGRVNVEIAPFANTASVLLDVQNAVDSIERFPPVNAEQPEVAIQEVGLEVMTLAVASSRLTEDELRIAAESVRSELLQLPTVSQVELRGTRDREISIEVNEEALRRNNLTIRRIANAVQRESLNVTFGELRTDAGGVILHTIAKREVGEDFRDIPLLTRLDGTILRLGDVAEVRDGFVDEETITRFNGQPAVLVRVDAAEEQSIVELSEEIRGWLDTFKAPRDVAIDVWSDSAKPAFDRLTDIIKNGVIGALLVFICLVIVFDLRVALWIAVGIPLSFVGSLIFFGAADLTLNMGTVFAFFLLVGIVVDDAVVVGESIAAERETGKSALDAAIGGAKAVFGPITIGVITTLLALVPFAFITTGNFQILAVFPYVAGFVLVVSLAEAFLILPAHLSYERPWSLSPLKDVQDWVRHWLEGLRESLVVPAVSWSVRHIGLTLACALVVVVAAFALVRSEIVRVVVFDSRVNATNSVQADLMLPTGAPFETTLSFAERFVSAAESINQQLGSDSINAVSMMVGNLASSKHGEEDRPRSHVASVRLHLNDHPIRTASPWDIAQLWRRNVGDTSYLESVEYETSRVRAKPSVAYAFKHDDVETLKEVVAELRQYLATVPGIYGVSDSLSLGKRHVEIELTPAAEAAGMTAALVGAQLRANYHGIEVQRLQRGHDELKVMVRYPSERRASLGELVRERIFQVGPGARVGVRDRIRNDEMPLAMVTRLTETRELGTLKRIDGQQATVVSAHADPSAITPIQARRKINAELMPDLLATYPDLKVEAEGGARDERAMLATLGVLVPIVLIAMYAFMAAFLRSYWKPLVAVVGIFLSFAGAIFGHWALGWDLTAISIFGMIGVSGVVVNDALVLMDRYNLLRRGNRMLPAIAAAAAAARHRFRAVFLTSLTTILGLSPLLYERSDELVFLVPFVVSMLGGLIMSALFILFVLPTLVMLAEGRTE